MVKLFGRRISHGNIHRLGRKIGHKAHVFGRKTLNTIDKVAPIASTAALLLGQPEIAAAINQGQESAHTVNDSIRSSVNTLTESGKPQRGSARKPGYTRENKNGKIGKVQFGDANVSAHEQRRNALLR